MFKLWDVRLAYVDNTEEQQGSWVTARFILIYQYSRHHEISSQSYSDRFGIPPTWRTSAPLPNAEDVITNETAALQINVQETLYF
jgi:hypothetical protein